jgi:hypothetical protein
MKPQPDLVGLIQRFDEVRETLVIMGRPDDETQAVELTADELRVVSKAMRYYQYWHDLPEDPNL